MNPSRDLCNRAVLTDKGQRTYDAAVRSYFQLADRLAEGLAVDEIKNRTPRLVGTAAKA